MISRSSAYFELSQVMPDWASRIHLDQWPQLLPLLTPGWEERALMQPPKLMDPQVSSPYEKASDEVKIYLKRI